jgi:hypothetical protein
MAKIITGITNGRPVDMHLVEDAFRSYEGKRVEINVKKFSYQRTNQQNRYWRGIVIPLIQEYSESMGEYLSEDDWHEYYVNKGYFGYKEVKVRGVVERRPKRSHEADTLEFNNAKEKVQREWAERGLIIPDPNQKDFL